MEKVKFQVGDKVVTIEQSQLKRGVIKDIYHLGTPILIVQFENGDVEKCVLSDVAPAPVDCPKTESDEKNEVTISENEFRDIGLNLITDLTVDKTISVAEGTIVTIILKVIDKKLFCDESNDD